jgi:hypothetical protein
MIDFKYGLPTVADIMIGRHVGPPTQFITRDPAESSALQSFGRLVKSLDISVEIGCKSVNQFGSETAF